MKRNILYVPDTSTESLNTQDTIEANGTDKDEIIFQGEFILEEDLFTGPSINTKTVQCIQG